MEVNCYVSCYVLRKGSASKLIMFIFIWSYLTLSISPYPHHPPLSHQLIACPPATTATHYTAITSSSNLQMTTTVVGHISNNDETYYRSEVSHLAKPCRDNNLSLNVEPNKEIIVDCENHPNTKNQALGSGNTHAFKDFKDNAEAIQGPMTLSQTQHTENHLNKFARLKITQR